MTTRPTPEQWARSIILRYGYGPKGADLDGMHDAITTAIRDYHAAHTPEITDAELAELVERLKRTPYRSTEWVTLVVDAAPSLLQAATENAQAREIIRDLRRKLAEAGVEGSPPPGGMGTIPTLAAENKRLREALAFYADPVKMNQFSPKKPGICVKAREALRGM